MQHLLAHWILNCLLNRLEVAKINKLSLISVETMYCHHCYILHSQKKCAKVTKKVLLGVQQLVTGAGPSK